MVVYDSLDSSCFSFVHSSGTSTESVMEDDQEVLHFGVYEKCSL